MKHKIDINVILKKDSNNKNKRSLELFDLSILGIGTMIGTGIVAAVNAGPAITFSFLLAALAAGLIGLCYSELTTNIPSSGSAYIYA
uniref:Amino acid permease-associated region n=1 Tax=Loigolactobacillus rennini TaxID=238013 RepID=A0A1K2I961_9LACO|nr:amino acid permease-associated region [Loigolactobacillus rennini]